MTFQFAPIIILYFIAAIITFSLGYSTWKLRPAQGATSWSIAMFFTSIFSLGVGLEVMFVEQYWKYLMLPVLYFGVTGLIFFWGLFCIQYSHHENWLNKYSITLLAIIPITTFILVATAQNHQFIYREYTFVNQDGLVLSKVESYGTFFWIWVAYAYGMQVFGSLIVIRSALKFPELFQGQAYTVILSVSIPAAASILYLGDLNPIEPYDPTPLSVLISGIIMFVAMKRFQFLAIAPIAHDLVFKHVESIVIVIDLQERIVNMNSSAESLFNRSVQEIIGVDVVDVFPQFGKLKEQYPDDAEIKTGITVSNTKYELRLMSLKNQQDNITGKIIMLYDLTEHIELEQKKLALAIEQERVKILQEFVRDASHDLNTPLSVMNTTLYLMRRESPNGNSKRLDTLDMQIRHLTSVIEDMLTMVRLDTNDTLEFKNIDAVSLINGIIQPFQEQPGPEIGIRSSLDNITIQGDEKELILALSNILENAIHHTPPAPDGKISVNIDKIDDTIKIAIKDNGNGIPHDDVPHIFDRFYRGDQARNTGHGSSGLGLAIVKRVVEKHKGEVSVTSELDEGSEFLIKLPVSAD